MKLILLTKIPILFAVSFLTKLSSATSEDSSPSTLSSFMLANYDVDFVPSRFDIQKFVPTVSILCKFSKKYNPSSLIPTLTTVMIPILGELHKKIKDVSADLEKFRPVALAKLTHPDEDYKEIFRDSVDFTLMETKSFDKAISSSDPLQEAFSCTSRIIYSLHNIHRILSMDCAIPRKFEFIVLSMIKRLSDLKMKLLEVDKRFIFEEKKGLQVFDLYMNKEILSAINQIVKKFNFDCLKFTTCVFDEDSFVDPFTEVAIIFVVKECIFECNVNSFFSACLKGNDQKAIQIIYKKVPEFLSKITGENLPIDCKFIIDIRITEASNEEIQAVFNRLGKNGLEVSPVQ